MLEPYHLISNLWNQQGKGDFDAIFDNIRNKLLSRRDDYVRENIRLDVTSVFRNKRVFELTHLVFLLRFDGSLNDFFHFFSFFLSFLLLSFELV